jgi:hypothetical protein
MGEVCECAYLCNVSIFRKTYSGIEFDLPVGREKVLVGPWRAPVPVGRG